MNKLEAMRAFVTIVEAGSLTAAGKELGRSLPSMVRTLSELEETLGVVLLRRTTRSMALTDEGRLYLERCRRILVDVDDAEALVRATHTPLHGRLRVTAPVRFGSLHVAPAIYAFVHEHPDIELELVLLDRLVDLVDEGFDLAVRIGPLGDSSLIASEVGSMRHVVCASPDLLRDTGVPRHPRELAELPCVGFPRLRGRPFHFQQGGKALSVAVRGRIDLSQADAAVEACVAGLGFGRFLHYQVAGAVSARRLRIVLEEFELPPQPVRLLWGGAPTVSPRLRALIDWLKPRLSSGTWSKRRARARGG